MVSADIYNAARGPTVLVAEIETRTRYRLRHRDRLRCRTRRPGGVAASRHMLGEHFGRLTDAQHERAVDQIMAALRGH